MKKLKLLMLFTLAFLTLGCREELDYVNSNNPSQNQNVFTKDNIVTKRLFKHDYETKFGLKTNVEAVNDFLKQTNLSSSAKNTSKSTIINGIEVYTDVFEEVDYLNAKYYSFYILGTAPTDYEQKLVLKYVDNQIVEKHIIKYKRLPNMQVDPKSYQLEKLVENTTGGGLNSKLMYIDTFSVGCTTYMITTFNCGHSGNHTNGQYCDVENAYMPEDIVVSYNNPNCNAGGGGGGGNSGSPGGGDGSPGGSPGGGGGIGGGVIDDPSTPTTPVVITIPTVAPIYSIKGIKTGTVKNPPDFNPLGLSTEEITQINSNDQFRLKIYQFLAVKQLYPLDFFLSDEQQTFVKATLKYIKDNPSIQVNDLNHEFLNMVYEFLQSDYIDIDSPLEIFQRFKTLDNAVTQNPNLLLDIPCSQLPFWQDVATHQVPQSVKSKLENIKNQTSWWSNWKITDLDDAASARVNMDLFPIKISSLPNKPNSNEKYTPAEFFNFFRLNINLFAEKFTPIVDSNYGIDDTALWNSSNPLGALIHIEIPIDDGTVVCSGVSSNAWIFSTIKAPMGMDYDGIHPVAGNRVFSYYMEGNTMYIYTRGVDRVSKKVTDTPNLANYIMEASAFLGADQLWTGMQDKLSAYVNQKGGSATKVPEITYRPKYSKIRDYLRNKAPLSSLGCN
ncbi:hypothetical protein [Chryseobacterium sp. JK1]|uniref:hypothetical protein n=1 Tax=Chryseobacterium sp. JK1 TaxID=874294 RepID=UPI003D68F0D7